MLEKVLVAICAFVCCVAGLTDEVEFFGRFDFTSKYPSADWPGSRVSFFVRSMAEGISVNLDIVPDVNNPYFEYYLGVEVDCVLVGRYDVNHEMDVLQFVLDSEIGAVHEISIVKLTEANLGAMSFSDISFEGAEIMNAKEQSSCYTKNKHMLVVGDSITAGYGVDGVYPCSFSAETENILDSYATLVGQNVGADVVTVAWSGKGMVRNYGDESTTSVDPMPMFYNRTLATSDDPLLYWNPSASSFQPNVVLITLGSNDYSTTPYPSDEDFINGYVALVEQIMVDYPNAKIAAVCEPTPGGNECVNVQYVADTLHIVYINIPDEIYTVPYGCDGHPSVEAQQNIANVITPIVVDMLEV